MKKLVSLFVPAISQSFDLFVPFDLEISKLIPVLTEAVETLSDNLYIQSGEELLCSADKSIVFLGCLCLDSYSIHHGEHLVLL